MNADFLRERILSLAAGLQGLGIGAEVYAMTLAELLGLYRLLWRLAEMKGGTP